jgi:hypothetical protein
MSKFSLYEFVSFLVKASAPMARTIDCPGLTPYRLTDPLNHVLFIPGWYVRMSCVHRPGTAGANWHRPGAAGTDHAAHVIGRMARREGHTTLVAGVRPSWLMRGHPYFQGHFCNTCVFWGKFVIF